MWQEPVFDSLQTTVLQPIASLLFPLEGCSLDRHHSFIVQYAARRTPRPNRYRCFPRALDRR